MAENNNANTPPPRRNLGCFTTPNSGSCGSSIMTPTVNANNFELKPKLVTLVQQNCQFSGSPQEDSNLFISNFLQICDTIKTNGVPAEVYRLLLFLFAVRDWAKQWLDNQHKESIATWEDLHEGESFYEAWERYKEMPRKCPLDIFANWIQIQIFYDGITLASRVSLDNSTGGSLHMKKTIDAALELIEMVANNQYLYSFKRSIRKRVMKLDALDTILAENKVLSQQINTITQYLGGMQVSAMSS
ncbi:hypothetical protein AHAS_Ahas11G0202200 [Arachis hypogaea]